MVVGTRCGGYSRSPRGTSFGFSQPPAVRRRVFAAARPPAASSFRMGAGDTASALLASSASSLQANGRASGTCDACRRAWVGRGRRTGGRPQDDLDTPVGEALAVPHTAGGSRRSRVSGGAPHLQGRCLTSVGIHDRRPRQSDRVSRGQSDLPQIAELAKVRLVARTRGGTVRGVPAPCGGVGRSGGAREMSRG